MAIVKALSRNVVHVAGYGVSNLGNTFEVTSSTPLDATDAVDPATTSAFNKNSLTSTGGQYVMSQPPVTVKEEVKKVKQVKVEDVAK